MTRTKFLEVRDVATFIPVVAVLLNSSNTPGGKYLLHRCGYDLIRTNVLLARMSGDGEAFSDPYGWPNITMRTAHLYLIDHWEDIVDGDVVCCEWIRGERSVPKLSERFA